MNRLGNLLNAIRAKNLEPRIKELALRMVMLEGGSRHDDHALMAYFRSELPDATDGEIEQAFDAMIGAFVAVAAN
jgi:hypothetical protein